jgi:transcriptional regulator with XRE-family HTH domain
MAAAPTTSFGDRAREARLELGLKQADVAERIGLSSEVYGRIERGTVVPRLTTLLSICEVLRVRPNDLLLDERAQSPRNDSTSPEMRQLLAILDGADAVTIKRVAEVARWLRSPRSFAPASRSTPRRKRSHRRS